MILLSQRDGRWANVKMLPSGITLGKAGCTTTAICMLSDYYGCFTLPSQAIDINIKYNTDGLILWDKINFPKFKFEKRLKIFDPVAINESLSNSAKSVILNVWHGSHWVVAIRGGIFGGYVVGDPWTGKKITIQAKDISGSAHFISK